MAIGELLAGPSAPAAPWIGARRPYRRALHPGWQIGAFVVGYPLWWILGITQFVPLMVAIPLAWQLRARGRVKVPSGFWLWLLFLVWAAVSVVALDVRVEGTLPSEGLGRYLSFTFRFLHYTSLTVIMLYVGNMSERELPRRRVIGWLAALGLWVIVFGILAVLFPATEMQTLLSRLLPPGILGENRGNLGLAQVQGVLGHPSPRPAAPFTYTNTWGNTISLLLIWLVVWTQLVRRAGHGYFLMLATLVLAVAPIIYSLNRGMWIGIGITIVVVGLRQAAQGKVAVSAAFCVVIAVASVALAFSPLSTIVSERLDNGESNDIRASLAQESVAAATGSPIIGYGSTRETIGADSSIAVGRTPDCPKCGNRDIGSTGQLWLILIAQGVVGAVLYLGFFLVTIWRHRGDRSAIGIAGTTVVGLEMFYSLFYSALIIPLAITLLSVALLWRNAQQDRPSEPAEAGSVTS